MMQKKQKISALRKALGVYSTGFIVVSDALAYFVKKTILIVHDFIPLVLLHRGVDFLQSTKNSIGKGLSEYTYCPKCAGNGVVFTKSDTINKMERKTCPLCKGTGKYYIDLSESRCDDDLCLTKDAAAEMALATHHLEELIRQAKEDQEKKRACCKSCKGTGKVLSKDDGQTREEKCFVCHGTGKDYSSLSKELMNRYLKDLMEAGFSKEDAKSKSINIFPKNNRAEILKLIKT